MQAHIDKINEMASVMKKAIEVDEGRICEDEERIKQLEVKAHAHFLLSTLQHIVFFWLIFSRCLQHKSVFCLFKQIKKVFYSLILKALLSATNTTSLKNS